MNKFHISSVSPHELEALRQIARQTFFETFAQHNSESDMQHYLNESFSSEKLARELGRAGSEFYFASHENRVVGYLKINFGSSQTEIQDHNALEIERIYVLQEYQGKKVGQLLYEQAIEIAGQKALDYVWLGVWEKNVRALRFYEKNGFSKFGQHRFKLGNDVQTDILMKKPLKQRSVQ
ncbi:GNAT family N-acetyltransferase [Dyadobacter sp. 676]|uniref:GNAT family N-acetyltransferase n=1 Tax=Dyadobacter sp. 676 TaxID=3088362 RepID=A0AAU8FJ74_9BACT